MMNPPSFRYDVQCGPVETPAELSASFTKGNCRLAVQSYLYLIHGFWLSQEQSLCPALYRSTGKFVEGGFTQATAGDILLAERIRNKTGSPVDRSRSSFATEDEWILYLHSAIVISPDSGKRDARIWHATAIAGGTCEWRQEEFENSYRLVAIKRVLP